MTSTDALRLVADANPVPRGAADAVAAELANELLDRLRSGQIEPQASSCESASRRSRRRVLVVTAAGALVIAVGAAVALADNGRPFAAIAAFIGIGSADHARTGQDVLDPQAARKVQRINRIAARAPARAKPLLFRLLPDTARLVGHLPGGDNVYVLENSRGDLCVLTVTYGDFCTHPLSSSKPVTIVESRRNPTAPPIAWGLARNDVSSVSFRASGRQVTVPVTNNVWFYVGESNALGSVTIHYSNGKNQTITHKRSHRS